MSGRFATMLAARDRNVCSAVCIAVGQPIELPDRQPLPERKSADGGGRGAEADGRGCRDRLRHGRRTGQAGGRGRRGAGAGDSAAAADADRRVRRRRRGAWRPRRRPRPSRARRRWARASARRRGANASASSARRRWKTPSTTSSCARFYLDRDKFDDSESEAWAAGRLGRAQDRLLPRPLRARRHRLHLAAALRARRTRTAPCCCSPARRATPCSARCTADVRITDEVHANLGRKGYDTPYINRNDSRMTPNTFEA